MCEDHSTNFIALCLQGKTLPTEIDDYIDSWHENDSSKPLHDFLGMTWKEYSLWVSNPDFLSHIITAHKEKTAIK